MTARKTKMKILVSDPLGPAGMQELRHQNSFLVEERHGLAPEALKKIIGDYDAIIVRSSTHLTKDVLEKAGRLRVIGRAGVGVDNVDLDAATKRGIIVMNTPEGNTVSTAEHTFSMILALARNIPQAHESMREGEWKRQKFLGAELSGKVLGVIGFGRIGREVAKRAAAFGMRILAHDPFISVTSVSEFPVQFVELKSLLKQADFISVHTPLTPETKYLLNAKNLKECKKGVRIINCARGGIVEEKGLLEALRAGIVAGAALDVFEEEPPGKNPLLKLPGVISTPHLGAATQEAQENVAVQVVRQVIDALEERAIRNAVNLPNLDPETYRALKPWLVLAEKMGRLHTQLFGGSLKTVTIRYGGEVTRYTLSPLTVAVMKGLLTPICGETVNFVNAPALARERGIAVNESRSTQQEDFSNYVELEVKTGSDGRTNRILGTLFGNKLPRIVNINEFWGLDIDPKGYVLVVKNEDQPGVVGKLGTILGDNKINIAEMSLARVTQGKKTLALTTINTDNAISEKVVEEIKKLPPILEVKVVTL